MGTSTPPDVSFKTARGLNLACTNLQCCSHRGWGSASGVDVRSKNKCRRNSMCVLMGSTEFSQGHKFKRPEAWLM